jgi:hypothetical protein
MRTVYSTFNTPRTIHAQGVISDGYKRYSPLTKTDPASVVISPGISAYRKHWAFYDATHDKTYEFHYAEGKLYYRSIDSFDADPLPVWNTVTSGGSSSFIDPNSIPDLHPGVDSGGVVNSDTISLIFKSVTSGGNSYIETGTFTCYSGSPGVVTSLTQDYLVDLGGFTAPSSHVSLFWAVGLTQTSYALIHYYGTVPYFGSVDYPYSQLYELGTYRTYGQLVDDVYVPNTVSSGRVAIAIVPFAVETTFDCIMRDPAGGGLIFHNNAVCNITDETHSTYFYVTDGIDLSDGTQKYTATYISGDRNVSYNNWNTVTSSSNEWMINILFHDGVGDTDIFGNGDLCRIFDPINHNYVWFTVSNHTEGESGTHQYICTYHSGTRGITYITNSEVRLTELSNCDVLTEIKKDQDPNGNYSHIQQQSFAIHIDGDDYFFLTTGGSLSTLKVSNSIASPLKSVYEKSYYASCWGQPTIIDGELKVPVCLSSLIGTTITDRHYILSGVDLLGGYDSHIYSLIESTLANLGGCIVKPGTDYFYIVPEGHYFIVFGNNGLESQIYKYTPSTSLTVTNFDSGQFSFANNKAFTASLSFTTKSTDPIFRTGNLFDFYLYYHDTNHIVQSAPSDTPPVSPVTGGRYIVGTSPTGDWSSHAKAVATYDSTWSFEAPTANQIERTGSTYYKYSGTAWVSKTILEISTKIARFNMNSLVSKLSRTNTGISNQIAMIGSSIAMRKLDAMKFDSYFDMFSQSKIYLSGEELNTRMARSNGSWIYDDDTGTIGINPASEPAFRFYPDIPTRNMFVAARFNMGTIPDPDEYQVSVGLLLNYKYENIAETSTRLGTDSTDVISSDRSHGGLLVELRTQDVGGTTYLRPRTEGRFPGGSTSSLMSESSQDITVPAENFWLAARLIDHKLTVMMRKESETTWTNLWDDYVNIPSNLYPDCGYGGIEMYNVETSLTQYGMTAQQNYVLLSTPNSVNEITDSDADYVRVDDEIIMITHRKTASDIALDNLRIYTNVDSFWPVDGSPIGSLYLGNVRYGYASIFTFSSPFILCSVDICPGKNPFQALDGLGIAIGKMQVGSTNISIITTYTASQRQYPSSSPLNIALSNPVTFSALERVCVLVYRQANGGAWELFSLYAPDSGLSCEVYEIDTDLTIKTGGYHATASTLDFKVRGLSPISGQLDSIVVGPFSSAGGEQYNNCALAIYEGIGYGSHVLVKYVGDHTNSKEFVVNKDATIYPKAFLGDSTSKIALISPWDVTRGVYGSQVNSHSIGANASTWHNYSPSADRVMILAGDRDYSLYDAIKDIANKAGVTVVGNQKSSGLTDNPTTHLKYLTVPINQTNCIISFSLSSTLTSGQKVGVFFDSAAASFVSGKVAYFTSTGVSIGTFGSGTITPTQSAAFSYDYHNLVISIYNNFVTFWGNDRLIWAFYLSSRVSGGYMTYFYTHDLSPTVDWNELDTFVENYIIDSGYAATASLAQVIGQRKVFFRDDPDGNLKVFKTRDEVEDSPIKILSFGYSETDDVVTRIVTEGIDVQEISNNTAANLYGDRFERISLDTFNSLDEMIEAGDTLLSDSYKQRNRRTITCPFPFSLEPGDQLTYTEPVESSSETIIVEDISVVLSSSKDAIILDAEISGYENQ